MIKTTGIKCVFEREREREIKKWYRVAETERKKKSVACLS